MFVGLSAFPLTPMNESGVDEESYLQFVRNLVSAKVDSIGVLGSTGNYAYLTLKERKRIIRLAVEASGDIPVMAGIGALRTRDILQAAEDAQKAGASAVLMAPMSYQKLTEDEAYTLYETVAMSLSVPLCVYENPGTTHFNFSDDLLIKLAHLPKITSIKLAGGLPNPELFFARVKSLRSALPKDVSLGISGDAYGAEALSSGCQVWYSAIGGLFPKIVLEIAKLALTGRSREAEKISANLEPLWIMFKMFGSLRVIATAAIILGLTKKNSLPLPLKPLARENYVHLQEVLERLELQ